MEISRKRFEVEAWYQLPTNRKWPKADQMMTSSMISRDHERSMCSGYANPERRWAGRRDHFPRGKVAFL